MQNSLSKIKLNHQSKPILCGLVCLLAGCQPANQTNSHQPNAAPPNIVSSTPASSINQTNQQARPVIYASTNLWAAVARAVVGDSADVIAAVNNPAQDPHGYQASVRDKAQMQQATLVMMNGGGYDDWARQIVQSLNPKPRVINAFAINHPHASETSHGHEEKHDHNHDHAGEHAHHHHHGETNEHVFYQLATVQQVATAVAQALSDANPNQQTLYQQNAAAFNAELDALKAQAQRVGQGKHLTVLATEPVADFLLTDMGITNVTPPEFVNQLANDEGVSVKALNAAQQLLTQKQVDMLVLNAQTEDAASRALLDTAKKMNIPVVTVYETLPNGTLSYVEFMRATIQRFAAASQAAQ